MKKTLSALMLGVALCGALACGNAIAAGKEVPEVSTIRWARANSGNVFVTIAKEKGYFAEAGLNVIEHPVANTPDALTSLGTGKVDVVSNSGTNNPLQYIAAGQDFTIVGGYMLKGMYIIAPKGTGWNGVQDLVGKKFAGPASQTAITGALLKAGFDPIKDVNWLTFSTNSDRMAAVVAGEADYAVLSGDLLYTVGNMKDVIEIVAWLEDLTPNYGCCRVELRTDFVKQNPITVKLLLKSVLRAECYLESHRDECVSILAKELNAPEEYVAAYLKNENYKPSVDPVKKSVIETWNVMMATGFLSENAKSINVTDHINTDLYKAALDELVAERYDEDPAFWDGRLKFFKENNE